MQIDQDCRNVLVVDDEPIIRSVCGMVLSKNGFTPILAKNGCEGISLYKERHSEICLVLSDIAMPLMNEVEMTHQIFEVESHPNIILMTGFNESVVVPEDLRRLCSMLSKPFTPVELMVAVKKCLKYEETHHPNSRFECAIK